MRLGTPEQNNVSAPPSGTEPSELSWGEVRAEFERMLDLPLPERPHHIARLEADRPRLAARLRGLLAGATSRVLEPGGPIDSVARELSIQPPRRDGERIGRFTVTRFLGAGGMGVVYEARDPTLERTVALKVIHAALASADGVRRLEREAHALARLRHPGIAQVYETGWVEPGASGGQRTPYIALEFIPGARPLDAKALSFPGLVERFLAVLDAVRHAHEHGVIHCDLKPANILLDRADQPKLIDFGVARLGAHMDTVSGGTAGTLRYMSPERCGARGAAADAKDTADTRADTFALGVILYELVEGRSPYGCIDGPIGELLDAVRSGAVTRPELLMVPPGSRRDFRAILAQAMAPDPGARYSSVAGLAEDLRRLLRHEPVAARPPTLLQEARLMARRNRVAVSAAVVVAAALCIGAVAATIGFIQARWAGAAARAEVARSQRVIRFLGSTFNSVNPEPLEALPSAGGGPDLMTQWLQTGASFGQARRVGREAGLVDVLLHAAEQIGIQFADDPVLEAKVALDLAQSLRIVGHGDESAALARRALKLRRVHLGPDHEDTLKALVYVAMYTSDDPDDATEAVRAVEARFGRADPRWFELRCQVVDATAATEGPAAGVAEAEWAIEECTPQFGPESRQLQALVFRRGLYRAQIPGGGTESRGEAERAVRAMIESDGGFTRATAEALFEVGMLYLQPEPARAEAILRDCLDVAPRFQGEANTLCYEIRTRLYEALLRQRRLDEAEAVAREQLQRARSAMGEVSYYTVKAKARVARVLTWAAGLGSPARLDEAEQLAREAAVDGLRFDEKSPGGDYDAYFRAIQAQALVLRGDAPSIRLADALVSETLEARSAVSGAAWCDGFLWLTIAQIREAQGREVDRRDALARAGAVLHELADPGHPIALTLHDLGRRP